MWAASTGVAGSNSPASCRNHAGRSRRRQQRNHRGDPTFLSVLRSKLMINCAIAGLGRWGRSLVESGKATPRLNITRAVETDLERARPFCSERGIALTSDFDSILSDPAIDAVLLATPHSLHRAQVLAAAKAGKQVFCEKPLALHREHAREMFDACRKANLVLAV